MFVISKGGHFNPDCCCDDNDSKDEFPVVYPVFTPPDTTTEELPSKGKRRKVKPVIPIPPEPPPPPPPPPFVCKRHISFNANNGVGIMSDLILDEEGFGLAPINTFTRSNHHFHGWGLTTTSSEAYYEGSVIYMLPTSTCELTTLYALWGEDGVIVTPPEPIPEVIHTYQCTSITKYADSWFGLPFIAWTIGIRNGAFYIGVSSLTIYYGWIKNFQHICYEYIDGVKCEFPYEDVSLKEYMGDTIFSWWEKLFHTGGIGKGYRSTLLIDLPLFSVPLNWDSFAPDTPEGEEIISPDKDKPDDVPALSPIPEEESLPLANDPVVTEIKVTTFSDTSLDASGKKDAKSWRALYDTLPTIWVWRTYNTVINGKDVKRTCTTITWADYLKYCSTLGRPIGGATDYVTIYIDDVWL